MQFKDVPGGFPGNVEGMPSPGQDFIYYYIVSIQPEYREIEIYKEHMNG